MKSTTDSEEEKEQKTRLIIVKLKEELISVLRSKAIESGISVNNYIGFLLNASQGKEKILLEEKIGKLEKKEIESRVYFTKSEALALRKHAQSNDWSLAKELRYRVLSTLSLKPKLSGEELKAVYCVRSSINILGANINRLIRNKQVLSDHNISICTELLESTKELVSKINYLEKCSSTHFKLKEKGVKKNVR